MDQDADRECEVHRAVSERQAAGEALDGMDARRVGPGDGQGRLVDVDAPHVVGRDQAGDRAEVAALAAADLEHRFDRVVLDQALPEGRPALVEDAIPGDVRLAEVTRPEALEPGGLVGIVLRQRRLQAGVVARSADWTG